MGNLSVIIPVYKPGKEFDNLFEKIFLQTVSPGKVILLWTIPNGEKEEDVRALSGKYAGDKVEIHYIKQQDFDHGGTRRYGMSLVKTDYALCMTQDALPYDNVLFEKLIKAIECEDDGGRTPACVYARQLPRENAGFVERITREFNYPDTDRIQNLDSLDRYGIKTYFCSDVCAMYKLDRYNEVGGFVKHTIFNEDMLMAAALVEAGYTVRYVAKAKVIHSHHYSYMEQYRRNFDLAVSHRQYAEVFDSVPSEGEGIRLVITTMKKLIGMGRLYLIPDLILQSACKYMGYRCGKRYEKLSMKKILKKTMNKSYWNNNNRSRENE